MNIEDYLSTDYFKTRRQLVNETGYSDRVVRDKISNLKIKRPVIYNSQTSGYRLAKNFEELSKEDLITELRLIQHCCFDIEARKKIFNQQERTYIATLEVGKKILHRKTFEEIRG